MSNLICPICESPSGGRIDGDATVFECGRCGGYRMSGTALTSLENGAIARPASQRFKELVEKKRGDGSEHPTITTYDLGVL